MLNAASPNPRSRPVVVVGGGVTPRTGLRLGAGYAAGDYATAQEITKDTFTGRALRMLSVEGEFAFGYTKLTGEFTRDALGVAKGDVHATQWFVQGVQTLAPRWFIGGRHEGANAPASPFFGPHPTLRFSEASVGYRLSTDVILKNAVVSRKTYYATSTDHQYAVSLVWARRWR